MTYNKSEVLVRIVEMLTPLSSEDRQKVVRAALALIGDDQVLVTQEIKGGFQNEMPELSPKASIWMKQNGLEIEDIEQVFHISNGNAEIIISELKGKNDKVKTHNAYKLMGISNFLMKGDSSFDDKSARSLCRSLGCYNEPNHSLYMKNKTNEFAGSKEKGWVLTAPGLKQGALLIKELIGKN